MTNEEKELLDLQRKFKELYESPKHGLIGVQYDHLQLNPEAFKSLAKGVDVITRHDEDGSIRLSAIVDDVCVITLV